MLRPAIIFKKVKTKQVDFKRIEQIAAKRGVAVYVILDEIVKAQLKIS